MQQFKSYSRNSQFTKRKRQTRTCTDDKLDPKNGYLSSGEKKERNFNAELPLIIPLLFSVLYLIMISLF